MTIIAGSAVTVAVVGSVGIWTATSAAADTSVEQSRASAQASYDKKAAVLDDAVTRLANSRSDARTRISQIDPLVNAPADLVDPSSMSTFTAAYNSLTNAVGSSIPALTTVPVITDAEDLGRDAKESAVLTIEQSTKRVEKLTKELDDMKSDLDDSMRATEAGVSGIAKTIAPSAQHVLDSTPQASSSIRKALSQAISNAQSASDPSKTAAALTTYITAAENAKASQSKEKAEAMQRALNEADQRAQDLANQLWNLQHGQG